MTTRSSSANLADQPFRITVVCLGNICRSPMGEAVLRSKVDQVGLARRVHVDSAGTGDWHVGHDADSRARSVLEQHGYRLDHRARQIDPTWLGDIDLLLAMDLANFGDLQRMKAEYASSRQGATGRSPQLRMLGSFDPRNSGLPAEDPRLSVPDPYTMDREAYVTVLAMIEAACEGLIVRLPSLLDARSPDMH